MTKERVRASGPTMSRRTLLTALPAAGGVFIASARSLPALTTTLDDRALHHARAMISLLQCVFPEATRLGVQVSWSIEGDQPAQLLATALRREGEKEKSLPRGTHWAPGVGVF